MDPREYTFVRTGPDCVCRHTRAAHVGMHPRFETLMWDLSCQVAGCMGCEPMGYRPLGPLSYYVLKASDEALMVADLVAERAKLHRLRGWSFVVLGASIAVGLAGSLARNFELDALVVPLAVLAFALIAAYTVITVAVTKMLSPPRGLTMATSLLGIPLLANITLQWLVPLPFETVVVTGVVCIGIGAVLLWVDGRRAQAVLARITGAMQEELDEVTDGLSVTVTELLAVVDAREADPREETP